MSDTNAALSQEMQHLIFPDILLADSSDFIPVIKTFNSNDTDTTLYRTIDQVLKPTEY